MLDGLERNDIIAGAYTDAAGICPMLAAHRGGGRTSFVGFARAWDAFAFRGCRKPRARRATARELLVLRTYLELSLIEDECGDVDLRAACAEHQALLARRPEAPPPAEIVAVSCRREDADRSRELRAAFGWRWMRIVRRLDDYERILSALGREAGDTPPARWPPRDEDARVLTGGDRRPV